jgi:hypothetical protein
MPKPDQEVSSGEPGGKEEGDARAKAFVKAYEESHPSGPYPPVETKAKPESEHPTEDLSGK